MCVYIFLCQYQQNTAGNKIMFTMSINNKLLGMQKNKKKMIHNQGKN